MRALLMRTDFESTEVDELAAGNRIHHQVLRVLNQGWTTLELLGKRCSPYFCLGTVQVKYSEASGPR
jgi:hypothetical protein